MFRSYFSIAVRQLAKQKLYSAINIVGLTVGLAAAMLLGSFIRHELSYDRYHTHADRVFRVSRTVSIPGVGPIYDASMPPVVGPLLKADFSAIESVARLVRRAPILSVGDRSYREIIAAADNEIFEILDFDWLGGDPATALGQPYSVVLTVSAARKYFGDERAVLGETLVMDGDRSLIVTGVIRDLPQNTHLSFSMLLSMSSMTAIGGSDMLERWNAGGFHTYVLLRNASDAAGIQAQSKEFFARHEPANIRGLSDLTVVPIADIHLGLPRQQEMKPGGNAAAVYASGVIAALILAIACINFVNLATACARRRAKEVGIRKTLGATRRGLVAQFIGESLVLTTIAALLALAVIELLLPAFGAFMQRDLEQYGSDPLLFVVLGGATLVVGLVAGGLPAFYLAAFESAKVLKGNVTRGGTAVFFRTVLVGAQFCIGIALVIGTIVIYQQMAFLRGADLGYDREQIVVVAGGPGNRLSERWDILKREWLAHPGIVAATASTWAPGLPHPGLADLIRGEGSDLQALPIGMSFVAVDFDFLATYDIDVLAGRGFSPEVGADLRDAELIGTANLTAATVAIVNVQAAKAFGWTPEEAIGKTFWTVPPSAPATGPNPDAPQRQIIGVIGDIHFQSLRDPVAPTMFILPRLLNEASLRVSGRDIEATLRHIDEVWSRVVPEQPIARRFLDDDFAALYRDEERQGSVLAYGALLAIFIACLGLFGLIAFTTEQRTKEIGIRKVLGGTARDIVRLLAGELGRVVLFANLFAWPVAYVVMSRWLGAFAYRIELGPAAFVATALLIFAIAWLTVASVAVRAAKARPVMSLRCD